ncbi:DUF5988 family protein [Actinoplanes sp. NPDC026619]|uniref:DUF5988 family protein n=1 Tax=Actinoplanes sp. NPDC026619 TaxID=3155798 RepID=UPI0033D91F3F
MKDYQLSATDDLTIDAVLEGGPVDIPTSMRQCSARPDDVKIKLRWGTGYEHFERTEEAFDTNVFRWTGSTRVAE